MLFRRRHVQQPLDAQTYARAFYHGVGAPTFTASTPACGHQVAATLTLRDCRRADERERAVDRERLLSMTVRPDRCAKPPHERGFARPPGGASRRPHGCQKAR